MSCQVPVPVAAECLGLTVGGVRAAIRFTSPAWGKCYKSRENHVYMIFSHELAKACDVPEKEITRRVNEYRARFKRKERV